MEVAIVVAQVTVKVIMVVVLGIVFQRREDYTSFVTKRGFGLINSTIVPMVKGTVTFEDFFMPELEIMFLEDHIYYYKH